MSLSPASLRTLLVDDGGSILDLDEAALTLLGGGRAKWLGAPLGKVLARTLPDGDGAAVFPAQVVTAAGRTVAAEVTLSARLGGRRTVVLCEVPVAEDLPSRVSRAVAGLPDSDEHFRTFAETLPDLAFLMDAQGQAYWWNSRHAAYFDSVDFAQVVHPDDNPRVERLWRHALATGEGLEVELRLVCKDGVVRPFRSYAVPVKRADGQVVRWCGLATDLSEAKDRERIQAFLLGFGEQLRQESSPEAVLRTSSQLLGEFLQIARVGYAQIDHGASEVEIAHDWARPGLETVAGRHDFQSDFVSMNAYRTGATTVTDDFLADPAVSALEREALARTGTRASVTAPLMKQGALVGIFAASHDRPRRWTPAEIALVEDVAERTWAAWERANAEARLNESEALFRGLAESLPNICWVTDGQGAMLWGNRAFHDLCGSDPRALTGDGDALVHPEDWAHVKTLWTDAYAKGEDIRLILRLRGPDGEYRPMLSQASPIREQGRVVRWCGMHTDLSEQYEREARQSFLLQLSEALRRETDPMAILRLTSERLGHHLKVDRVVYGDMDPASGEIVSPCAWCAPDLPSMDGQRLKPTHDNWVLVGYRDGKTLAAPDYADLAETTENFRRLHKAIGATAFITAPLVKEGRLHGLFSVYDRHRRDWSAGEISLVEEVGERTWEALWRARAEAGSRASEEQFRTFAESLPDIAFVVDAAGAPLWWNRRHEELLGPGQGMAHIAVMCHPDEVGEVMAKWGTAMAAGEPIRAECRLMCVDGRYRLFNAYAMPVKDPSGAVMRWCGLCRDVTEARAHERNQVFLNDLGEALRAAASRDELLSEATTRLARHLKVDLTGFSELQADGDTLMIQQECVNGDLPSFGAVMHLSDFGASPTMQALGQGRSLLIRDSEAELVGDPMLDGCRAIGVRATISVPILVEGAFRAILFADHGSPREDWSALDLEMVREVAERTWASLERVRAEAERRDTEALLSAIMTNAPVGIYVKDLEGRYALMNAEMGRMLGRDAGELIGHTAAEVLDEGLAAHVAEIDAQVLATGRAIVNERRMTEAPGAPFHWTLSTRFPVQSRPGAPLQVAGINVDLTAQKLAEQALERSREALHQSEKLTALGSLLAGVSHELNNPLSIVVAQAVMMERQAGDSGLAERARQIRAAADRCARIVQTFLAMARQKAPERRRTDLNGVVNAALELTAYGLRTSGVKLVREQAERLPAISADADQLHQVIINLVINAQQAMQEQQSPRLLIVRTYAPDDGVSVALEIADTGPGVPAEMRRRIFEPFFTTKPQDVGTGVGLSFSQGLVEAHGGALELVESEPGATFRVTLPVSVAAEPIIARPAVLALGEGPARKALVVDDEPQIARALAEFLELEGYACDTAFGGGDAKAMLAGAADYDLIVSDLRMPDVDGPSLFAWIKAERPDLARRVAFSTGDTLGAPAVRFLAREGRPFMEKPFTPESLRDLLDDLQASQ